MKIRMKRVVRGAMFSCALAMAQQALATTYSLSVVGDFRSTGNADTPYAINSYGQVVGSLSVPDTPFPSRRPFLWTPSTPNGKVGSLQQLTLPTGAGYSDAQSINSLGQITGSFSINSDVRPFLWTPTSPNATTGSAVDLWTGASQKAMYARGINNHGQIAGGGDGLGFIQPFIWQPSSPNASTGAFTGLGGFGLNEITEGNAINNYGQVTGHTVYGLDPAPEGPILWTPTTANGTTKLSHVILPDLPGGTQQGAGWAINDSGWVVGQSSATGADHAFVFIPSAPRASTGTMIDLGILINGSQLSYASGINNSGRVVGGGANGGVVWSQSDGMQSLGSLLDSSGAGWSIGRAEAINDIGQIVGIGSYDPDGPGAIPRVYGMYLLTPVPEPGALAFIAAASLIMMRRTTPLMRAIA